VRIVLVPGFTQFASSWDVVTAYLPDLDADPDIDLVSAEVPDGLDFPATAAAIGDEHGPAVYVGYSMGGRLCLQLALDHSELVERLVLVSASPGIADPSARDERRRSDDALADRVERDGVDAFLEHWLAQPMFASLPVAAADLEARRANTVERLARQLRLLGQGIQPSNWERLGEIGVSTALFVGSKDTKYVSIAGDMAGPMHANLRVLTDRGHACHLESPGTFASLLRSWLLG